MVILRDQAEGCLLHQMNYIVAWSNIPEQSLNHSNGDVDQALGLADDYLSFDNRVSLEGRWDFSQSRVNRHWIGKTLTGGLHGTARRRQRVWEGGLGVLAGSDAIQSDVGCE